MLDKEVQGFLGFIILLTKNIEQYKIQFRNCIPNLYKGVVLCILLEEWKAD